MGDPRQSAIASQNFAARIGQQTGAGCGGPWSSARTANEPAFSKRLQRRPSAWWRSNRQEIGDVRHFGLSGRLSHIHQRELAVRWMPEPAGMRRPKRCANTNRAARPHSRKKHRELSRTCSVRWARSTGGSLNMALDKMLRSTEMSSVGSGQKRCRSRRRETFMAGENLRSRRHPRRAPSIFAKRRRPTRVEAQGYLLARPPRMETPCYWRR